MVVVKVVQECQSREGGCVLHYQTDVVFAALAQPGTQQTVAFRAMPTGTWASTSVHADGQKCCCALMERDKRGGDSYARGDSAREVSVHKLVHEQTGLRPMRQLVYADSANDVLVPINMH